MPTNGTTDQTLDSQISSDVAEQADSRDHQTGRQSFMAVGGILGALAASSCCIAPLVLFSLGISGAWIGNLTALYPYKPIFVTVTLGFLAGGFYLTYRKPKFVTCTNGAACARPVSRRIVKVSLWSATLLIGAALVFPYTAPLLLGV